jgi:hypothetical protein
VQSRPQKSDDKLEAWKELGVDFRPTNSLSLRLFVFDNRVAYITSYDEATKDKAFGIRFSYPPFAGTFR